MKILFFSKFHYYYDIVFHHLCKDIISLIMEFQFIFGTKLWISLWKKLFHWPHRLIHSPCCDANEHYFLMPSHKSWHAFVMVSHWCHCSLTLSIRKRLKFWLKLDSSHEWYLEYYVCIRWMSMFHKGSCV
jgi:hypothetical protein